MITESIPFDRMSVTPTRDEALQQVLPSLEIRDITLDAAIVMIQPECDATQKIKAHITLVITLCTQGNVGPCGIGGRHLPVSSKNASTPHSMCSLHMSSTAVLRNVSLLYKVTLSPLSFWHRSQPFQSLLYLLVKMHAPLFSAVTLLFGLIIGQVLAKSRTVNPDLVAKLKMAATQLDRMDLLPNDLDWLFDFNAQHDYTFSPGSVVNANVSLALIFHFGLD